VLAAEKPKGHPVPQESPLPNPLGRHSKPEEQAEAVLFPALGGASYINGVTLEVNGGVYMR
jgi:NAD(P)-dependent dehydrogenase (short-subunit alcohol dehydrogenase family)